MEIVIKCLAKHKTVGEVNPGELFDYAGAVCMKIEHKDPYGYCRAFCLSNEAKPHMAGSIIGIQPNTLITPLRQVQAAVLAPEG